MVGRYMQWSREHRDLYVFNGTEWVLLTCMMPVHMTCTAPHTLKRGTKFDGRQTVRDIDWEMAEAQGGK